MKTRNYLSLAIVLLMLNACNKPKVLTKDVKFTSTTYADLSTYNSQGLPDGLLKDTIPPDLINFIDTLLPDGRNLTIAHPELFSNPAIGDITITSPSTVYITYVSQSGGLNNALAFYTYPTNQPPTKPTDISKITYVFPNAGNLTPLISGDKANIGNFNVGISIGFVLMKNAWDPTTASLNNDAVHFLTNDALNPEVDPKLKKHAVLIPYAPANKVLIGFEDFNRTSAGCDNDFNDVVFYVTVTH
ncbi:MAG: DUF4114 domain-containing protein [Bacteroidota bacterium]|nr:DUF4114 domain-containing protein [Bacteroidota bacterium]